jgi:hypothetical protein
MQTITKNEIAQNMFIKAVSYRKSAIENQQTFSFYQGELKIGEYDCSKLNAKMQREGIDFSWVFYPSGQVVVYFLFNDGDDKFNDITKEVEKWSLYQKSETQKKVAFG